MSKYWIWGPLKPYMAYLFMACRDLTWSCNAQIRYTLPCEGCRECKNLMKVDSTIAYLQQQQNSRWWHAFIPRTKSPSTSMHLLFLSIIIIINLHLKLHLFNKVHQ